ncbi:hypothetical protein FRC07_013533, partial [Ceratobasidium sp. 392]
DFVRSTTHTTVDDPDALWNNVDTDTRSIINSKCRNMHHYLWRFKGSWATEEMAKRALSNRRDTNKRIESAGGSEAWTKKHREACKKKSGEAAGNQDNREGEAAQGKPQDASKNKSKKRARSPAPSDDPDRRSEDHPGTASTKKDKARDKPPTEPARKEVEVPMGPYRRRKLELQKKVQAEEQTRQAQKGKARATSEDKSNASEDESDASEDKSDASEDKSDASEDEPDATGAEKLGWGHQVNPNAPSTSHSEAQGNVAKGPTAQDATVRASHDTNKSNAKASKSSKRKRVQSEPEDSSEESSGSDDEEQPAKKQKSKHSAPDSTFPSTSSTLAASSSPSCPPIPTEPQSHQAIAESTPTAPVAQNKTTNKTGPKPKMRPPPPPSDDGSESEPEQRSKTAGSSRQQDAPSSKSVSQPPAKSRKAKQEMIDTAEGVQ